MVNGKVRIFSAQRGEPCSTFSIHLHFGSSASFGLQPNGVHVTVTWDEHIIIDRRRIMRPGSGQTRMSNDCSSDVKVDSKLGRGLLRDCKTLRNFRLTFVWSSTHHQQSAVSSQHHPRLMLPASPQWDHGCIPACSLIQGDGPWSSPTGGKLSASDE